jgi:hypothetical protein
MKTKEADNNKITFPLVPEDTKVSWWRMFRIPHEEKPWRRLSLGRTIPTEVPVEMQEIFYIG